VCCVCLVVYQFLFCNFPSKLHTVFYTVKTTCRLPAFHIKTQLTNIKLQTQFFTTVTLMQFCVSKSPPFNVTSLIAVQLACNNNKVVNTSHQELIRSLPINRFPLVTQSECHAQYIHPLFNNSIHIAHSTQLNSSQTFSNIPTVLKQFHSSRFLRITLQHDFLYRHTVRSSWFYCNTFVPCVTSNSTA